MTVTANKGKSATESAVLACLGIESADGETPNVLEIQADVQKPATCPTAEYSAGENADKPTNVDDAPDATMSITEIQADAQKPAECPTAEYSADEHADAPEDVAKANESTFIGVYLKNAFGTEAFASKKTGVRGIYPSIEAFLKSEESKNALEFAKKWAASKNNMSLATNADVEAWLNNSISGKSYRVDIRKFNGKVVYFGGAVFAYRVFFDMYGVGKAARYTIDIFLKKGNSIRVKTFVNNLKISKDVKVQGIESTNPVDIAFGNL
jgi:hypothetical protein